MEKWVQEVVTVIFKTCSFVATIMECLKMTGQGRVNLLKRAGNGSAQRIIAIAPGRSFGTEILLVICFLESGMM